jgi:hypothetical protein
LRASQASTARCRGLIEAATQQIEAKGIDSIAFRGFVAAASLKRIWHGRRYLVAAVNSMFTGSSGALGEFRAGALAAWLGAVPSALIGGIGALAVMLIWMWGFPQLRRVDKLGGDKEP